MPSSLKAHVVAFFRAVGIGALAGAGPVLLLTFPLGLLSSGDPNGNIFGIWIAILPLVVSFSADLCASVFVGLPTFYFLKETNTESVERYTSVGFFAGGLPSIAFALLDTSSFFIVTVGILGVVAGGVTGNIWGKFRESYRADSVN